jgi:hypothetical protein
LIVEWPLKRVQAGLVGELAFTDNSAAWRASLFSATTHFCTYLLLMPTPVTPQTGWRSRAVSRGALAAFVTAAALLAWPQGIAWHQRRFAEQLAHYAVQSTSSYARSIRQLQQLGTPATASLMRLASFQRPEVAVAAQNAVADQLAAWEIEFSELGDRTLYAEQLVALSTALRQHSREFDAAGRHWGQKLARQIVLQCDYLTAEDAWAILAQCEFVLSTPAGRPMSDQPRVTKLVAPAPPAEPPSVPLIPRDSGPEALQAPRVELNEALSPGDSERFSELAVIMPSTSPAPANAGDHEAAHPRPAVSTLRADTLESDERPIPPAPLDGWASAVDVPSPLDMRHAKQRLRGLTDQELIVLSDTASRFEAAAARQALRRRGYSDAMLGMTREIRRLPASERRQALDRADMLPPSDARRLLRWFVTDEDAEVRLHALTLLATSGDPQLSEIARRRAIDDDDPRVADLANKLLHAK